MRLLRLDLKAFGPFTNQVLDLSGGSPGLHFIFGLNEAGKSSTLRALEQLFFGMPEKSGDEFLHPSPKLRLGACLENGQGQRLEFWRRRGRKTVLYDRDDATPLDNRLLDQMLGKMDRDLFTTFFGLDRDKLKQGGREILEGGGHLGRILFSAGSGLAQLNLVQDGLKKDMAQLFLGGAAKNPSINQGLLEIRTRREKIKSLQLPCENWQEQERLLASAEERRTALQQEKEAVGAELSKFNRLRTGRTLLAKRNDLLLQLQKYTDLPAISDAFLEQLQVLQADRVADRAEYEKIRQSLETLERDLETLEVPVKLLHHADAIEDLHRRLGSFQNAQKERNELLRKMPQEELQVRDLEHKLAPLGQPLEITEDQQAELRSHTQERHRLVTQYRQAKEEVDRQRLKLHEKVKGSAAGNDGSVGPDPSLFPTLEQADRMVQAWSQLHLHRTRLDAGLEEVDRLLLKIRDRLAGDSPASADFPLLDAVNQAARHEVLEFIETFLNERREYFLREQTQTQEQETNLHAEWEKQWPIGMSPAMQPAELQTWWRSQGDVGVLNEQVRLAREKFQAVEAEVEVWKANWQRFLRSAGLLSEPEVTSTPALDSESTPGKKAPFDPDQVQQLLDRSRLYLARFQNLENQRQRLQALEGELDAFGLEVAKIIHDLQPGKEPEPAQAAARLHEQLKKAREIELRRQNVLDQRDKLKTALLLVERRLAQHQARLAEFCREVQCGDEEALLAQVERRRTWQKLERDLGQLEENLVVLQGDLSWELFLEELNAIQVDQLPARLNELEKRRRLLEEELSRANEEVGRLKKVLEDMDGNARAAEEEEEAQALLARVQAEAESFLVLRLAAGILQDSIERYRRKNEAGVVERARELFQTLTLGSFAGLEIDTDAKGQAILHGIRGRDRMPVAVEDLSEGTRDQLYLAFRLASLEIYLQNHEPFPFIVDDLLVNFDDPRSRAALGILGQLARKTQVIFFTHHQHLLKLAREAIPDDVLVIHRLM